jgi:transposase
MERRSFDQEFREGAVRIAWETGKPIAQVARELGVNEGTLSRWVILNRLRRENAEFAMERHVLKRAAARCIEEAMRRWAWPRSSLCRGPSTVSPGRVVVPSAGGWFLGAVATLL